MTSGVLRAPAAGAAPAASAAPATTVPTVVVAGAPGTGKTSVVAALLGRPDPAPVGGLRSPAAGDGDRPVDAAGAPGLAGAPPFVVYRHGAAGADSATRAGRPARRVDRLLPVPLLSAVTLVDTPGDSGLDPAYTEIVLDAAAHGRLLFVTSAAATLTMDQLDFLAEADRRGIAATFVLTGVDAHPTWPAVLATDQALVHDHAPSLAGSRWFAINARDPLGASGPDRPALGPEEAARGLAGLDVADLHSFLGTAGAAPADAGPPSPPVAMTIAATVTDEHWRDLLDSEVQARQATALRWAAVDLSVSHVRCVQELGSGRGCVAVVHVLDRELLALSTRTNRLFDAAANALLHRVFTAILETAPDPAVLARVRPAVRRCLDDGGSEERILQLTATSGVAITTGTGAGMAGPGELAGTVLPPVGIALTAGCYQMWHQRGSADKKECRRWLQQAIRAVEAEIQRDLARRFADLRRAVATVASDAVDHGVLLA
jgi:hypothetical protein